MEGLEGLKPLPEVARWVARRMRSQRVLSPNGPTRVAPGAPIKSKEVLGSSMGSPRAHERPEAQRMKGPKRGLLQGPCRARWQAHCMAWRCMALHGVAWRCMALHGVAEMGKSAMRKPMRSPRA